MIDRYTKGVLTVIAICLVWLSFGGPALLPTAAAQQGPQLPAGVTQVAIRGWVDRNGDFVFLPAPPLNLDRVGKTPDPSAIPVAVK